MKIVILAGGGGTRLWPISREKKPKQFCQLFSEKTLLEETVERFLGVFEVEDIFICTSQELAEQAKRLLPLIPEKNYIFEPERQDTAAAMGLVVAFFSKQFPDEPIVFVPADHLITNRELFIRLIKKGGALVQATGKLVDIAVTPTFPSTVLGYTHIGKRIEDGEIKVYEFQGHKEKPDFATAQQYLKAGDYLWHASYYMWTPRKILAAFQQYSPANFQILEKMISAMQDGAGEKINALFRQLEKISFDYAITEKIDPTQVLILRGEFGWSDVGAFDVLSEAKKAQADSQGNLLAANVVLEQSSGCLIFGSVDKIIAAIGVEDLIIVDSEDALLICPKSKAQAVKKIVEKLRQQGKDDVL